MSANLKGCHWGCCTRLHPRRERPIRRRLERRQGRFAVAEGLADMEPALDDYEEDDYYDDYDMDLPRSFEAFLDGNGGFVMPDWDDF